uniref:Uncharacterized protein n=1 Tax=viral metagenome TaxID=1070528 RepID=A0A6C0K675_9ZZZZ
MGQQLFTHHDKYHLHKVLGFGCLFNFFLRIYWLLAYGSMYIYADSPHLPHSPLSLLIPVAHLTLSLSSLIFQVPLTRLNSKIIIWKELQLHNMVFTSRSAMIMIYSIICIRNDIDMSNKYYYLYQIGKLAIVVFHHMLADYITLKYNTNEKTTTRDINWENIPDNVKKSLKQYYAICQILAINALILTDNDKTGSGAIEAAFLVMFPIQLSTFLMTLVRKSIITNIHWHIFYALSLVSPFFIVINMLGNANMNNNDNSKNKLEVAKIYLPILYIIFRLQYNFNKYYLMFHIFIINQYIQYKNSRIML